MGKANRILFSKTARLSERSSLVLILRAALIVLSVLLAHCESAYAEDSSPQIGGIESMIEVQPEPLYTDLEEPKVLEAEVRAPTFPSLFGDQWGVVLTYISRNAIRPAHDALLELNRMRIAHGFEALEDFSIQLLQIAEVKMTENDTETAAFLIRKALLLSPNSPRVLFESASMMKITGDGTFAGNLIAALKESLNHPGLMAGLAVHIAYPLLWSLTLGFYVILLLYLVFSVRVSVRAISGYFPMFLRGVFAPLVVFLAILAPCAAGPLWSIAVWTVLLLLAHSEKRWLSFAIGTLFVLWATIVPIRENVDHWLQDPGIQTMLNVASGYYSPGDKKQLEELVKQRPDDGVAFYMYGQLLRRLGEYELANAAMLRSEFLLGEQPWTKAARGLIQYLMGHNELAMKLMDEAENRGMSGAAFYFNRSKISFELMDTERSKEQYRIASRADAALTQVLSERERLLGDDSKKAMAEISLPLRKVLRSALVPVGSGASDIDSIIKLLMPGTNPVVMMGIGSALILWALMVGRNVKRARFISCYESFKHSHLVVCFFRCIPGGSWVLSGEPFKAVFIVSLLIFMCMPLVLWPKQGAFILDATNSYHEFYCLAVAGLTLALILFGWEKEARQ